MKDFVLEETTIAQVHRAMEEGILTCRELVEGYLARIDTYDQNGPAIKSIININPNALEEACKFDREFKQRGLVGPLHGIPVLLKDNIDTFDMPTTAGSLSLQGIVPEKDAFIISKLREAGALILAKVNLHEFAIWGETISSILGQTLNPYDLTRTPGGSSGGTGASVAANFGLVGIGTDTINSVRSPASANNLVGIRPTIGLVSRNGIVPYSLTQDTAGPITRTVEDAARVLDVIACYDKSDPQTSWSFGRRPKTYIDYLRIDGLKDKRIGVLKSFFGNKSIHADINRVVRNSIETMKGKGAVIIPINIRIDSEYLVKNVSVHLHELKDHLNTYLNDLPNKSSVHTVKQILDSGKHHPGIEENLKKAMNLGTETPEYNRRMLERERVRTKVMKIMADYKLDAIVYPHQKQLVCLVGENQKERNGVLGSVLGFPSICIQSGFSSPSNSAPIGVPIGMEILGKPFEEETLIEIAYSFEQASRNRKMPPSTPSL